MNKLLQSAAKPQNFEESSQTIPEGSTLSNNLDFGSGCPSAHNGGGDDIVENKRKTNFINKSILKFKDNFDYSQVEYKNAKTKVKIICKKHGEFMQTPDKHLQSVYACPTCNEESRSLRRKGKNLNNSNRTKSFEQFVEESNNKYKNKFTYLLEEDWKGVTKTKVIIICPIHGKKEIKASNHLQKNNIYGCIECSNSNRALNKTGSYENAIKQFNSIFNNFYTYPIENKETYKNKKSKIKIICPIHGEFTKSAQKHLSKQGCFECKIEELVEKGLLPGGYSKEVFEENPELKLISAYLYYLKINDGKYYKIGISRNHPKERIKSLKSKARSFGELLEFEILKFEEMTLYEAYQKEQSILNTNSNCRVYRKWSTELFNVNINF